MKVSKDKILATLPAYRDQWVMVRKDQNVDDIITQILKAHKKYAPLYDRFSYLFDSGDLEETCNSLYDFCQRNIDYVEEPGEDQTTSLPTGILIRGTGDCKHYASFCGGVLDSIQRQTGQPINWQYRFASYRTNKRAHHVFIVVNDADGREIWIDPVPGANTKTPLWILDKKVKSQPMALRENIGFIHASNSIGWTVETSTGYTTSGPTIVPKVGDSFYGTDWLGLSRYGSPTNTDLNTLTAQLNAIIAKGPHPYTLTKDLVEKILRDNVAYWNFYYPNGTSPTPRNWDSLPGIKDYLRFTITQDGRLTFDRDGEPSHDNPYIHYLADEANFYVQKFSDKPYIVLIDHLKRLGRAYHTPAEGSLWHVIHEGDVNFSKITDFVGKIPGLQSFLASFGVSLDSLKEYATKFLGGSSGAIDTGGQINPSPYSNTAGASTNTRTMMIVAGAGLAAWLVLRKKSRTSLSGLDNDTLLIGGGLLLLYFLSRKSAAAPGSGDSNPPGTVPVSPLPATQPPSTATPPFIAKNPIPSPIPYQVKTVSEENADEVFIKTSRPILVSDVPPIQNQTN